MWFGCGFLCFHQGFIEGGARLGFPAPVFFAWAAALAECAGGLLVALGLGTRIAAGFAATTMAVAAFVRHHALTLLVAWLGLASVPEETLKAWGNPELALVYLLGAPGGAAPGSGAVLARPPVAPQAVAAPGAVAAR